MSCIAKKAEIEDFLEKSRDYIAQNKIDFIRGKEEKYTLGKLGISFEDAFAMAYELTIDNYYRGPTPDHSYPDQEVMEFGIEDVFPEKAYPNSALYIKLTFRPRKDDLLMMSFHPAEKPINYPYKETN